MAKILTLTLNPALDLTVQLPRLEPGQVNRSEDMHTHAAGKGVNVAQVLADLGHQVTVSGFLGEDNLQAFETLFAKRGFIDAFIRVPGETRSNIKLAESYIERAGQTDVTVGVYPEARHEIFNETNKEEVLDDMISWISERLAS